MSRQGWENILEDGEDILWQGRPDTGLHLKLRDRVMMAFGVASVGLGIYWLYMVPRSEGLIWAMGWIFVVLGPVIVWRGLTEGRNLRRNTWYTLTTRRAIISTDTMMRGAKLESYEINAGTELEFSPGALATINFAEKVLHTYQSKDHIVSVGFEHIGEGEKVYRLMQDVQKSGDGDAAG